MDVANMSLSLLTDNLQLTPPSASLATSPFSPWVMDSTSSLSTISTPTGPTYPTFNWNLTNSPPSLGAVDINDFKSMTISGEATGFNSTFPASIPTPLLSQAIQIPDIGPFKGRLLVTPSPTDAFPQEAPVNPLTVLSPTLPSPNTPSTTPPVKMAPDAAILSPTAENVDPERPVSRVLGVRLTANGKRIGRPPGTFKNPRKLLDQLLPGVKQVPEYISDDEEGPECECKWEQCGKLFTVKKDFYIHVHGHVTHLAKERIFDCCWEGCSNTEHSALYQLVTHVRSHTQEKPNRCPWENCTKKYSRLENLKTHIRTHTGEKPFKCKMEGCEKAFTNASDCSKHMNRTHNDTKPYGCLYPGCPKCYTDPSSLRKHHKSCHPDYEIMTAHIPKPERSRQHKSKVNSSKRKTPYQSQFSSGSPAFGTTPSPFSLSQLAGLGALASPIPSLPFLNTLGVAQFPLLTQNPFLRTPLTPITPLTPVSPISPLPLQPSCFNFSAFQQPNPLLVDAFKNMLAMSGTVPLSPFTGMTGLGTVPSMFPTAAFPGFPFSPLTPQTLTPQSPMFSQTDENMN